MGLLFGLGLIVSPMPRALVFLGFLHVLTGTSVFETGASAGPAVTRLELNYVIPVGYALSVCGQLPAHCENFDGEVWHVTPSEFRFGRLAVRLGTVRQYA
jgi:hypothetical protein